MSPTRAPSQATSKACRHANARPPSTQHEIDPELAGRLLVEREDQRFEGAGPVLIEHLDREGHPGMSSKLGIIDQV